MNSYPVILALLLLSLCVIVLLAFRHFELRRERVQLERDLLDIDIRCKRADEKVAEQEAALTNLQREIDTMTRRESEFSVALTAAKQELSELKVEAEKLRKMGARQGELLTHQPTTPSNVYMPIRDYVKRCNDATLKQTFYQYMQGRKSVCGLGRRLRQSYKLTDFQEYPQGAHYNIRDLDKVLLPCLKSLTS